MAIRVESMTQTALGALLCSILISMPASSSLASGLVWLEAESFAATGGWVVDQQFMDLMGSPYLLAHGLGEPVPDAIESVKFAEPGNYKVWVRTRAWVAPWNAPAHGQI